MIYIAYLDEFGHIGPYISSNHPKHKTHPAFGLGGIVIPAEKAREFSTYFYQLKCNLLAWELKQSNVHPAKWEKKGSSLYTTKNITQYPELRKATFRLLNKIEKMGGFIFFVGQMKKNSIDPKDVYKHLLREAIKRLDDECSVQNAKLIIILDEQENSARDKNASMRAHIVEASAIEMHGESNRKSLIEPPIQAESHLYQNLQCADWICGLIGRYSFYEIEPQTKPDLVWVNTYFKTRILQTQRRSGIRQLPKVDDLKNKFSR
jgi:hypothetical protein